MADANFASVLALLLMNGTNGSTTFVDSSNSARTCTANGNAQLTTTSPKYGSACGTFDNNSDYVALGGTDIVLSGDYTIDLWAKWTGSFNGTCCLLGANGASGSTGWFTLGVNGGSPGGLQFKTGTYNNDVLTGALTSKNDGNWHHLEMGKSGSTVYQFADGTSLGSATSTATLNNAATSIWVGYNPATSTWYGGAPTWASWGGQMDCVRITSGVCRHTSGFTPPTSEDDYLPATGGPFPHYTMRRHRGGFYVPSGSLASSRVAPFRQLHGRSRVYVRRPDSGLLVPGRGIQ